MTVYMLKNNKTGLYYRRGPSWTTRWVKQEKASIWTFKVGPAQAKSRFATAKQVDIEIVPFQLTETQ